MTRFLILILLLTSFNVSAEIYNDIRPLDKLGDVKAKFPNAKIKQMNPAWLQPNDALYEFTGEGLSGSIIIKFTDMRAGYKKQLEDQSLSDSERELKTRLANRSDDDSYSIDWVRFLPASPFPIQRLLAKYGVPEKSDFSSDNYQPYRNWTKKGIVAYLTDNEKNVERVDFYFTDEEYRLDMLSRIKEITPAKKKPM